MKRLLLAVLLALAAAAPARAQSAGPQPIPSPWRVMYPAVGYDFGGILLPTSVLGGNKGVGTANVAAGYYVAGLPLDFPNLPGKLQASQLTSAVVVSALGFNPLQAPGTTPVTGHCASWSGGQIVDAGYTCNSGSGGSGSVSNASANQLAYYPSTGTTVTGLALDGTMTLTGSTLGVAAARLPASVTGIRKGAGYGGSDVPATAGTDYVVPTGSGAGLTGITPSQVGALALSGGNLTGGLGLTTASATGGTAGGANLYVNPTQPIPGVYTAGSNVFGTCPLTQAPCGYSAGATNYNVYSQQYLKDTTSLGATQQEFNWSLDSYINTGAAPQWAPSTIYAAGACVDTTVAGTSQAGNIYCTTAGGTSASTGTGPSGTSVPIADGTVSWTSAIGDFTNQKVSWFNSALVGPSASSRTWGNAEATIWQQGYTGIQGLNFEMDAQNNAINVNLPGYVAENLRLGGTIGYYPMTADLHVYHGNSGLPVAAGSFVVGQTYTILTAGTTSFTAIGAANNSAGTVFTATGAGSGTGTAANTYAAQYGILFNGIYEASKADIATSTWSPYFIYSGGIHAQAVWGDTSTAPVGANMNGTYNVAAYLSPNFKVDPTGHVTGASFGGPTFQQTGTAGATPALDTSGTSPVSIPAGATLTLPAGRGELLMSVVATGTNNICKFMFAGGVVTLIKQTETNCGTAVASGVLSLTFSSGSNTYVLNNGLSSVGTFYLSQTKISVGN